MLALYVCWINQIFVTGLVCSCISFGYQRKYKLYVMSYFESLYSTNNDYFKSFINITFFNKIRVIFSWMCRHGF